MILTQTVQCPYCGHSNVHALDLANHTRTSNHSTIATCEPHTANPHKDGCGGRYMLQWDLMVLVRAFKIDGQETAA